MGKQSYQQSFILPNKLLRSGSSNISFGRVSYCLYFGAVFWYKLCI
jgi:hypothetical protein